MLLDVVDDVLNSLDLLVMDVISSVLAKTGTDIIAASTSSSDLLLCHSFSCLVICV